MWHASPSSFLPPVLSSLLPHSSLTPVLPCITSADSQLQIATLALFCQLQYRLNDSTISESQNVYCYLDFQTWLWGSSPEKASIRSAGAGNLWILVAPYTAHLLNCASHFLYLSHTIHTHPPTHNTHTHPHTIHIHTIHTHNTHTHTIHIHTQYTHNTHTHTIHTCMYTLGSNERADCRTSKASFHVDHTFTFITCVA